jgi:cytochrome P450
MAPLPPGPSAPRTVQSLGFIVGGLRYLDWCRRHYGDAVTFRTLFGPPWVMVFDPALVKEVFQAPAEQLHAGEANALLGPVVGERSVLLLDESEHLRHRRLMLPPFHGRRLQAYAELMRAATDEEIEAWPVGEPFSMLGSMQALTLRIILRAVFGYSAGPEEDELHRRIRAMIDPLNDTRSLFMRFLIARLRGDRRSPLAFGLARDAVDELIFAEIGRRRADPALSDRDDVFSALLQTEMTDDEVRDELVTLLLAGHETTATGLAWTFDLLLHSPAVHVRALNGDDEYLDAVVKEALRIRPVIPGVGRVVRGQPMRLNGYEVPPGVEINPSIRVMHQRADLFPDPAAFRPERFLGDDAPDTYTWIPFGGGTRRCLGASFALQEMRIVLQRVLQRTALRPASRALDEPRLTFVTQVPKHGVQVIRDR